MGALEVGLIGADCFNSFHRFLVLSLFLVLSGNVGVDIYWDVSPVSSLVTVLRHHESLEFFL